MSTSQQSTETIREMQPDDLDQVIAIEREVFLFPWSRMNFADSLTAKYYCRVLAKNELVFGYGVMITAADESHILTVGIAGKWQKKGWGQKLLKHFIQQASRQSSRTMILDVRESNTGAINLYKQLGFLPIGKRKGYYPAMCGREDAIVMELIL